MKLIQVYTQNEEQETLLKEAAAIKTLSLSAFVRVAAIEKARSIIKKSGDDNDIR